PLGARARRTTRRGHQRPSESTSHGGCVCRGSSRGGSPARGPAVERSHSTVATRCACVLLLATRSNLTHLHNCIQLNSMTEFTELSQVVHLWRRRPGFAWVASHALIWGSRLSRWCLPYQSVMRLLRFWGVICRSLQMAALTPRLLPISAAAAKRRMSSNVSAA